jgi:hypothetical protein
MVGNTRATSDTRRIRRLKTPVRIEVQASEDGVPLRLRSAGAWQEVALMRRPWRIDQHWWRGDAVRRDYFRVAPADGPPLTIYRDAVSREWFRQEY